LEENCSGEKHRIVIKNERERAVESRGGGGWGVRREAGHRSRYKKRESIMMMTRHEIG